MGHVCGSGFISVCNGVSVIIPAVMLICDQSLFCTPPCRTQNSLFLPENMARLSETFSRAHEVMDAEKNVVLGKRSFVHMCYTP